MPGFWKKSSKTSAFVSLPMFLQPGFGVCHTQKIRYLCIFSSGAVLCSIHHLPHCQRTGEKIRKAKQRRDVGGCWLAEPIRGFEVVLKCHVLQLFDSRRFVQMIPWKRQQRMNAFMWTRVEVYATSPKTHQVEKRSKQKPGCHLGKVLEKGIYPFYPLKTNI